MAGWVWATFRAWASPETKIAPTAAAASTRATRNALRDAPGWLPFRICQAETLITKNVSVEPSSASSALETFVSGKGDVLLDYESDAIAAEKAGDKIQYVIPKQTILIQTPIAVTAKSKHATQANAFLKYQWSTAGQTIWAQQGYRPVLSSVAAKFTKQFPTPPQLFTIGFLGGWTKVKSTFFDPSSGTITKLEQDGGFPTASS